MSQIRATKERSTFRQVVSVSADIQASAEAVWALLTSAEAQRSWNSTLVSIEGTVANGETVTLVAKSAPERTFRLAVSEVKPHEGMVWSDGNFVFRGVRTFELVPTDTGVRFTMTEEMTGMMLPLIVGSLPDFVPVFETYAADLKRAAEAA